MLLPQNINEKEKIKMAKKNNTVLMTKNLSDIFYHMKAVNDLQIIGGGTQINEIKEKSICIRNIDELKTIDKKERYIDIGSEVTLNTLLSLGENKIPKILFDAVSSISNFSVRNLATIGGNICSKDFYYTLYSPLHALEARLEFKNQTETHYIPFSKFNEIPKGCILTKIRIPLEDWDVQIFKRVGPENIITELSSSYSFLMQSQKDTVYNINICYAGKVLFDCQDLENKLIGTHLPISSKYIEKTLEDAKELYEKKFELYEVQPIVKKQFFQLLKYSLEQLM